MITVLETKRFRNWLNSIRDLTTRIRLARRLEKVQRGQFGDIKRLSEFLYEMREFFGVGWRMYYFQQESVTIVMLNGGCKKTQTTDIQLAKFMVKELRE